MGFNFYIIILIKTIFILPDSIKHDVNNSRLRILKEHKYPFDFFRSVYKNDI